MAGTQGNLNVPVAPQVNVNDWIDYLLEDANGTHTYSNDRALFGYIQAEKYLVLPAGLLPAQPPNTDLTIVGNTAGASQVLGQNGDVYRNTNPYIPANTISNLQLAQIICLNYHTLRNSGMDVGPAYLCAQLRARWIYLGCLFRNLNDRATPYNEVLTIRDDHPDFGQVVGAANLRALSTTPQFQAFATDTTPLINHDIFGKEFVTKWAETIWGISELLFRIRGHHYKVEYHELITRTMRATTEGSINLPPTFPFADVFHTSIHPFGVRVLPIMAYHFIAHGRFGNSLIIRFSGSPNGSALFTTLSAGISIISSEPWYNQWESSFKDKIQLAKSFAEQVINNKYGYHMSANLYGVIRRNTFVIGNKTYTISEAENEVSSLSPYIVGYANAVNEAAINSNTVGLSFATQQVLNKRVATNPIASLKMMKLVDVTLQMMERAKSTAEVVANITNVPNASSSTAIIASNPASGSN